jgi:hypothetical protein
MGMEWPGSLAGNIHHRESTLCLFLMERNSEMQKLNGMCGGKILWRK